MRFRFQHNSWLDVLAITLTDRRPLENRKCLCDGERFFSVSVAYLKDNGARTDRFAICEGCKTLWEIV